MIEQEPEPLVRLGGRAEPGELAHRPQAPAVHRRVDAAGERELSRVAQITLEIDLAGLGGRKRHHIEARQRREELAAALRCASASCAPALEAVRRSGCHFSPDPRASRSRTGRTAVSGGASVPRRRVVTTAPTPRQRDAEQHRCPPAVPVDQPAAAEAATGDTARDRRAEPRERLGHGAGGGNAADLAVDRGNDRGDREARRRTAAAAIVPIDPAASGRAISPVRANVPSMIRRRSSLDGRRPARRPPTSEPAENPARATPARARLPSASAKAGTAISTDRTRDRDRGTATRSSCTPTAERAPSRALCRSSAGPASRTGGIRENANVPTAARTAAPATAATGPTVARTATRSGPPTKITSWSAASRA